ncbi:hypothetical protein ACEQPO_23295 [Bacillus sp. SL00103]
MEHFRPSAEALQSSDGDETDVRASLEQLIPIVQDILTTENVLQAIGERPADVLKEESALTTDQVQELEKAKKAIENVLPAELNSRKQNKQGRTCPKSARTSRCTNSSSALFLREISQQRKSGDAGSASCG